MFEVTENGKTYLVGLRKAYAHIRSEKKLRALVESGIKNWETKSPKYAEALRKKSLWEVCSLFGITSAKREVRK